MSDIRVAHRYALAAISVAEEMNIVDIVSKDFVLVEKMFVAVRDFRIFMKSPVIHTEKKKTVLMNVLRGNVHDFTLKFILLLTSRGREAVLRDVCKEFYRLRDVRRGILNVTARATVTFTDEQRRQLIQQIEQVTKKTVHLNVELDTSLQGGFTVQYEDTVWDASVRHQLETLRQRFVEGTI
jgi:F-type H+-transporting ATPase subunit delta